MENITVARHSHRTNKSECGNNPTLSIIGLDPTTQTYLPIIPSPLAGEGGAKRRERGLPAVIKTPTTPASTKEPSSQQFCKNCGAFGHLLPYRCALQEKGMIFEVTFLWYSSL
jgi:hypothetical protein